jgi:hypothetical protein
MMAWRRWTSRKVDSARLHLVGCRKGRRVPVADVDAWLRELVAGVAAEVDSEVIENEVLNDERHLSAQQPVVVGGIGGRASAGGCTRLRGAPEAVW